MFVVAGSRTKSRAFTLQPLSTDEGEVYQVGTVRHGLILYNPTDREGAVEEADNLQSGLQAVGCQVIREEWTTKIQLYKGIADGLRAADGRSVLTVCVMSHGTAGTLRSEDGDGSVLINDLMVLLTRSVPDNVPMVRKEKCNFMLAKCAPVGEFNGYLLSTSRVLKSQLCMVAGG